MCLRPHPFVTTSLVCVYLTADKVWLHGDPVLKLNAILQITLPHSLCFLFITDPLMDNLYIKKNITFVII